MRVGRRPLQPSMPWGVREAAEKILVRFEQTDGHVPLQGLRELLEDLWSNLDLKWSEIQTAVAIAIAQIRDPEPVVEDVITQFASAFRTEQEDMRDKVATVSHDNLAGTEPIGGQAIAGLVNEPMSVLTNLAQDVAQRVKETEWGEPVVEHFVAQYRKLLGVGLLRAERMRDLFYAGDAFRSLFERAIPIVLIAASTPTNEDAVESLFAGLYEVIVERGLDARVSHVGRLSAMGAQGAAYRAARRIKKLEHIGVCSPDEKFLTVPVAPVHKGAILGGSSGDEMWFFCEMAQRGVAIVLGGDEQALNEAQHILKYSPSRTILCGGFGVESRSDLVDLAGTTHALWISNASTDRAAGRRLGAIVSEMLNSSHANFWSDPLLSVAFRQHPATLPGSLASLLENDGRNRIVRLVDSASNRLERAGVPSAQVWSTVSRLAKELAQRVLDAPDPDRDPNAIARWRERAMEAFRASGNRLLMDLDVEQDVRFASRPAIKRRTL